MKELCKYTCEFLKKEKFWLTSLKEALSKCISDIYPYEFGCKQITKGNLPKESDIIIGFYNNFEEIQCFSLCIGINHTQNIIIPPKSVFYPFDGNYPIVILALAFEVLKIKSECELNDIYCIHCFVKDRDERILLSIKDHQFKFREDTVYLQDGKITFTPFHILNTDL